MSIQEKLRILISVFAGTQGTGKTYLVMHGLKNPKDSDKPAILITHSVKYGRELKAYYKMTHNVKIVSVENLEALIGDRYPIVFDNHALEELFVDALDKINAQEKLIKDLKQHLFIIKKEVLKAEYI